MDVTKKELRIISYKFRVQASRVMSSHFQDALSNLEFFIDHIDSSELIATFIRSKIKEVDIASDIKNLRYNWINTGNTPDEEISYMYQLFKYLVENNIHYYHLPLGYSSTKYQDATKEFNQRIFLPFINHIEEHLTELGIEMGVDEEVTFHINNMGQLNIAQGHSTVNATQNQGMKPDEVIALINSITSALKNEPNVADEDREIILDATQTLSKEIVKSKPEPSTLRTCKKMLEAISSKVGSTVSFAADLATIISVISQFM